MGEKKIGSRTFRANKLPATTAVDLMFRLGKIVGPALGSLATMSVTELKTTGANIVSMPKPDDSNEDGLAAAASAAQRERVLSVVGNLFGQLEPATSQKLLVELCEHAQVQMPQGNYDQIIFDAVFSDNILDAFQVAAFVVQVNFGDFLAAGQPKG